MIALLVGIALFMWYELDGIFDGMCGNEIYTETWSPTKEYRVVVFQRDCGATTDFSTQVSILAAADQLSSDDVGNAYIASEHPDQSQLVITWLRSDLVSIHGTQEPLIESGIERLSVFLKDKVVTVVVE